MPSLQKKVALITGGSRGIGAAIAHKLAALGAHVAFTYKHNQQAAKRVAACIREEGGVAECFMADVSDIASVRALFSSVVKCFGHIDILINNAGVFGRRGLEDIDAAFFAEQFSTNAWGTLLMTQQAVPYFPPQGGCIVNFSSQCVYSPRNGTGVYAASKAAVEALTHACAIELGGRGITVNAIAPAATQTDMIAGMTGERRKAIEAATPLGRLARPEDIADIVAFLASDEARWINGRTIRADGGMT